MKKVHFPVIDFKPQFIIDLENNSLIRRIIHNENFTNVDFKNLDFTEEWDNQYVFKNVQIGDIKTTKLYVNLFHQGMWLYISTKDGRILSNIDYYFGWRGVWFEKKDLSQMITKVKLYWYQIFDKKATISIEAIDQEIRRIKVWILSENDYLNNLHL